LNTTSKQQIGQTTTGGSNVPRVRFYDTENGYNTDSETTAVADSLYIKT